MEPPDFSQIIPADTLHYDNSLQLGQLEGVQTAVNDPMQPIGDDSSDSPSGRGHQGLPKATIMVSFVTILTAGVATFLAMQWSGSRAASQTVNQQLESEVIPLETEVSQELGILRGQLTDLQTQASVLGSGPFYFCNNDDVPVTIKHLASTFLNSSGEFETFSTEEYGENLWEVPARTQVKLDFGRGAIWDGSVTYYSLILEKDNEGGDRAQIPFSGYWKPEHTECVLSWPSV
jgi:hypothetical protein